MDKNLYWLYGIHACQQALLNSKRHKRRLLVTDEDKLSKLGDLKHLKTLKVEIVPKKNIENVVGNQVVHQGVALEVQPLPVHHDFEPFITDEQNQRIMVLDQVNDVQNLGAILRSCAVFGVKCLIVHDVVGLKENGILAKVAAGSLEHVPIVQAKNLSRVLDDLKKEGFWCIGFSEKGNQSVDQVNLSGRSALVMGSEGQGLRDLVEKKCDILAFLPTTDAFSTLNVAQASSIALYETFRQQKT